MKLCMLNAICLQIRQTGEAVIPKLVLVSSVYRFACQYLTRGDMILSVNGEKASEQRTAIEVRKLLNDAPIDTMVHLLIKKREISGECI